jgi:chemotaxis protein CheD
MDGYMGESQLVGMAQIKVTKSGDTALMALGLGSCIAICAYDPVKRVAGIAHVVLPDSGGNGQPPGKFADTAVPLLLRDMTEAGADVSRIRVVLIGGAQLFSGYASVPQLEIGARNAKSVVANLQRHRIPIAGLDIGGFRGRTVHFYSSGQLRVKTIGAGEKELTVFCQGAHAASSARGELRQDNV